MKNKVLLFLIPSLRGGGAERVMSTLIREFDFEGCEIVLCVVNLRGSVFHERIPSSVRVIDLSCNRVRYALPKMLRLIWKLRPSLVFSTLGHLNLGLAIMRPFFPRELLVVGRETIVVSENNKNYSFPRFWDAAYRMFLPRFDAIICQSSDMYHDLVDCYSFPKNKAIIINNPIDIEMVRSLASEEQVETGYDPGCVNIVASGRLASQKGFDLLLRAFSFIENAKLTILGEGPERESLIRISDELGIRDRVCFAGFQRNPYPYYKSADMFVLSSRYEGFPNVVLEALACGTPVVATPAKGGVKEILSGVSGCLIAETISVESLKESIVKMISSGCHRVAESAVSHYGVEEVTRRYEDAITGILSRRH